MSEIANSEVVRKGFRGRQVYLRPALIEDATIFANWTETSDPQLLSSSMQPLKPSAYWVERFKATFTDEGIATLAVVRQADDGVIGRLVYDKVNLLNRSARIDSLGDPEIKKTEELSEGLKLLLSYLFMQFDLNSIYTSFSKVEEKTLKFYESLGFKRDGVLRQRHFFAGEFHDVYAYSLLRFEFKIRI